MLSLCVLLSLSLLLLLLLLLLLSKSVLSRSCSSPPLPPPLPSSRPSVGDGGRGARRHVLSRGERTSGNTMMSPNTDALMRPVGAHVCSRRSYLSVRGQRRDQSGSAGTPASALGRSRHTIMKRVKEGSYQESPLVCITRPQRHDGRKTSPSRTGPVCSALIG